MGRTMRWKNDYSHYGAITKAFHWATFLLVVNQFVTALVMETRIIKVGGGFYDWHKSVGLLVLVVVCGRLIWRKASQLPEWAEGMYGWEISVIRFVERSLYVLLFAMPVSGIAMLLGAAQKVPFFGLLHIPAPAKRIELLVAIGTLVHVVAAYALCATIAVHVAFVLRRHWYERGGYLHRMLPFSKDD